jgi:tRNA uridine 5-carboxymethylaminomethyl modification enzyme
MYGGRIEGVGPRYCPSIEDKVVRFADKEAHRIFLEPEGLDTHLVYPNGISTSLPPDVQEEYVRSIQGLEKARITQPGYAIEYDYIDPRALDRTLSVGMMKGLFLAGQINGTTGYEEAAGQGLLAGLNAAALALGRAPVVLDRSQAYIGVMVDDLVTRGVSEPYRMFTSRAEYRLQLRPDNADQRLTPVGTEIGCIGEERRVAFERKSAALEAAGALARSLRLSPEEAARSGLEVNHDGVRRSGFELMSHAGLGLEAIVRAMPELAEVPADILAQVQRDATYAPYLARQTHDIERLRRDAAVSLPAAIDYRAIGGLSGELKDKLEVIRPENLAQASRIEGMTPAALTQILLRARQDERERAAG